MTGLPGSVRELDKELYMTARNDITGDTLVTKGTTDDYRDGWDRIFGKKKLDPTNSKLPPAGDSSPTLQEAVEGLQSGVLGSTELPDNQL